MYVLNAPESAEPLIEELKRNSEVHQKLPDRPSKLLCILVFAEHRKSLLESLSQIAAYLDAHTVWWIAYPKRSNTRYNSDLTRDTGWDAVGALGYEPVRQIALDETWSALRFRPVGMIRRLTRDERMILSNEAKKRVQHERD